MFDSIVCGVILSIWGRLLLSCMKAANQGLWDVRGQDHVKPWKRGLCFFWLGGHIPQVHVVDCTGIRGV